MNKKAEIIKKASALSQNINASKSLQDIMKTNLGPKGTLKMLVGGAGQIKLTKDGSVLLSEMQIQHPTATMIARSANAQDDIVGDGTTSNILFIGELLKQSERVLQTGVHPRNLVDGFDLAKQQTLEVLSRMEQKVENIHLNRDLLVKVARSSLCTKLERELCEQLSNIVTDAVTSIRLEDGNIDLHMVEVMHMKHKMQAETKQINGLVLDHGARNDNMPKQLENTQILTCNISLEYEKTEVNTVLTYSSAEQRQKLVEAERAFTDEKVRKLIDFKRKVCDAPDSKVKNFVIINQKGIDPISLEALQKDGILALRRAKRRNMERLTLACGGNAVNSVEDLTVEDLGYAGKVYEHTVGEEKQTFVEDVPKSKSVTILVKGQNDHSIAQIKDAIRDGLRAVKLAIDDGAVLPGAAAFEIAVSAHLRDFARTVKGKERLGVEAFSEAILVIPRTLSENAGFDSQEQILNVLSEHETSKKWLGVDLTTGEHMDSMQEGVYDLVSVKRQMMSLTPILVQQLLLVDEIMRAGISLNKQQN